MSKLELKNPNVNSPRKLPTAYWTLHKIAGTLRGVDAFDVALEVLEPSETRLSSPLSMILCRAKNCMPLHQEIMNSTAGGEEILSTRGV